MADRASARLFGMMFGYLAKQPPSKDRDEFAAELWKLGGEYDFGWCQMFADDALVTLDFARPWVDPRHPEEGEILIYRGSAGFDEAAPAGSPESIRRNGQ